MSAGSGAENDTTAPIAGWVNESSFACSACLSIMASAFLAIRATSPEKPPQLVRLPP